MSKGHFIRCDHWRLLGNPGLVACANDTIDEYRLLTNALCSVVLTHWPSLASSTTQIQDLERLVHPTKDNPDTVYGRWFQARFARFKPVNATTPISMPRTTSEPGIFGANAPKPLLI